MQTDPAFMMKKYIDINQVVIKCNYFDHFFKSLDTQTLLSRVQNKLIDVHNFEVEIDIWRKVESAPTHVYNFKVIKIFLVYLSSALLNRIHRKELGFVFNCV